MRFLVTPEFNSKLEQLPDAERTPIATVANFISSTKREELSLGTSGIEVRTLSEGIITIRSGNYRVYASFGNDAEGEFLLLLDITSEQHPAHATSFATVKDPTRNMMIDPNRNMMIDPRRNMMIDPHRNMMIDPNRNMMIDPRRNMMIDPNRNMMIDPRRNMMIDPNRNMMIDPRRNMMIDPRRNTLYGGPYVYNTKLVQEGFVVRANDDVSLIFDPSGNFASYIVSNKSNGANVFDVAANWIGFLVRPPQAEHLQLRFDTGGQWIGLIV